MYDSETVDAARERDGAKADERPDEIDALLNWEQLGYESGEPLAADEYGQYPESPKELSNPVYGELIGRLLSSSKVNEWDDAVAELTAATGDRLIVRDWRESLQAAADAAAVDADKCLGVGDERDCGGPEAALNALTDELSDDIVAANNALCLAYLYAEKGLSIDEISEVFETDDRRELRRRLFGLGLVDRREDKPQGKTASDILVNSNVSETEDNEGGADGDGVTVDVTE